MSADHISELSSLDEIPVYFRVFTRDSLKVIQQRMEEEAAANAILERENAEKKGEQVCEKIYYPHYSYVVYANLVRENKIM